jgi:polysaccharide deacetylase family protein (PEP-CTERM system associated)
VGYRAPSFSIGLNDLDKFEVLAKLGFEYDSSVFPIRHFRYGEAQAAPLAPFDIKKDNRILLREYPLTVVEYLGKRIPAAGGGYFRLYPDFLIKMNISKAQREGRPVITYLHPWEFDPAQPRIKGAGFGNTFRHYVNLHSTEKKLEMLLSNYEFGPFKSAIQE